jgi:hypothetical protein
VKIAGEHRSLEGKREIKVSKHASDKLCCRGTFVFNNFCFDTTTLFFTNNANTSSFTRRRSGMPAQARAVVVAFLLRGRRPPFSLSTNMRGMGSRRPGLVDRGGGSTARRRWLPGGIVRSGGCLQSTADTAAAANWQPRQGLSLNDDQSGKGGAASGLLPQSVTGMAPATAGRRRLADPLHGVVGQRIAVLVELVRRATTPNRRVRRPARSGAGLYTAEAAYDGWDVPRARR